jgi:hypothetical protein
MTQIRMKESERSAITDKTTDRALNEIGISHKKRNARDLENAFKKGKRGLNAIKTIVVFTSENPDGQEMSSQFNKKARNSLLSTLKQGGYACVPAVGQFGNNKERPYAVFNMSLGTAKNFNGRYQQKSFIYSQLNDDGSIHSEYWEKEDTEKPYNKHHNDYIMKDQCDEWDMSDAEDMFTVVGKNFKYSIPFSIFADTYEAISNNASALVEQERRRSNGTTINEDRLIDMTINQVGYSPCLWRKALTRGING